MALLIIRISEFPLEYVISMGVKGHICKPTHEKSPWIE